MTIAGSRRAMWRWNGRRRLGSERALVLLYHSIADAPIDPWQLSVSTAHFAEHLEVLREWGPVARLGELGQALRERRELPGLIGISFDDGYANNLHAAAHLLAAHGVPATVFIATQYIATQCVSAPYEFWWNELERILLYPGTLPPTLELRISGRRYAWALGQEATYSPETARARRRWVCGQKAPGVRQEVFLSLYWLLRPLKEPERRAVVDQLSAWSGSQPRDTYRALTVPELRLLADVGPFEVGAHSCTHPVLAGLDEDEQRLEIGASKARLEEWLDRPVQLFAYPYGGANEVDARAVATVRAVGYTGAFVNVVGTCGYGSDLYRLPRASVSDMNGDKLARRLHRWAAR